jgi:hypothetical protein
MKLLWAMSLLFATACTSEYAYVPANTPTATVQGRVAATLSIPPEGPQGSVRVASYGMTDVEAQDQPEVSLHAIHLRVVLADDAPTPWTFDTREQHVEIGGAPPLAVAFASANAGSQPPLVTVDSSARRVVDLFFLLPEDQQAAEEIPQFSVLSRVDTSVGPVVQRTPFKRVDVDEDEDESGYTEWGYAPEYYYWGGPYWINPLFPYVGLPPGYFAGGVVVHPAPHFGHGGGGFHGGLYGGGGFHGGHGGFHGGGFHGGGFHGGGGHGGGGHGGGGHR